MGLAMTINYTTRFTGGQADDHFIPAFEAGQSLHGLARGFVVVGHYLAKGEVRHRYPFNSGIEIYMGPPRRGSFETVFQLVADPNVQMFGGALGAVALGITANFASDFIRHIYRKASGQEEAIQTDPVAEIEDARPGDIDALVDALEPALKLAHTSVGAGAANVIIIGGTGNIVNFNSNTKRYLHAENREDDSTTQDLSVGSFNVNSRGGRVYFHDLGKTVPFSISSNCTPETIPAISHSLNQYALGLPSDISVTFLRTIAGDGSVKKIFILGAEKIPDEDVG